MEQQRIYTVTSKADGKSRLVMASNPSQAVRFVANDLFEVKAASSVVVATLMTEGTKLERASGQEDEATIPMQYPEAA